MCNRPVTIQLKIFESHYCAKSNFSRKIFSNGHFGQLGSSLPGSDKIPQRHDATEQKKMMSPNQIIKRWCHTATKKEKKTSMPLAWPIHFEYLFCHWIGPKNWFNSIRQGWPGNFMFCYGDLFIFRKVVVLALEDILGNRILASLKTLVSLLKVLSLPS